MAPFFIVGSGRSGSTLLRLMLASHSRIAIPAETWFLADLVEECVQSLKVYAKLLEQLERQATGQPLKEPARPGLNGQDTFEQDRFDAASAGGE